MLKIMVSGNGCLQNRDCREHRLIMSNQRVNEIFFESTFNSFFVFAFINFFNPFVQPRIEGEFEAPLHSLSIFSFPQGMSLKDRESLEIV